MLSLVLHALRARRTQSVTMFALAMLAALGAAAAPWFYDWGRDAVARAHIAAAPTADRLLTVSGNVRHEPGADSPVDILRERIAEHLPVAGAQIEYGARIFVSVTPVESPPDPGSAPAEVQSADMSLAARDGICSMVTLIDGRCPASGEVMLSRRAATTLGVVPGDEVSVRGIRLDRRGTLRVAGIYEVTDPYADYWTGTKLLPAVHNNDDITPDPAWVDEQTLLGLEPDGMEIDAHLLLPEHAFADQDSGLRTALAVGVPALIIEGMVPATVGPRELLRRITSDQLLVGLGVGLGAIQLVIVCWVGLFLAVRHTSQERRADIGLLKLRGVSTGRVWALVGLSSGVPMIAGTVVGAAGGFLAAVGLAAGDGTGSLFAVARTVAADPVRTLLLSLGAAVIAGLGGLVAAVAAEWRTIRAPVVDLLRRVPARQRGWRADVADLVLVVLAAAGVYQAGVEVREGDRLSELALLAPTLVALAVALVVARAIAPVAARIGQSTLRAGRAGAALAALQLARRQGIHRIFMVLAVAAAVLTSTALAWQAAGAAWHQRAVQELGAARVLQVDAASASALLQAVRSVDPDGRYAMAVASSLSGEPRDRVLAVDATRYAQVGLLPDGMAAPAELAPALRSELPAAPLVSDGPLTLDVEAVPAPQPAPQPDPSQEGPASEPVGSPVAAELDLVLHLSTSDASPVRVEYPDLVAGRQSVTATVQGCEPVCRLVAIEVVVPAAERARVPVVVDIYGLHGAGGSILSAQDLGDITRWRTGLLERTVPPTLDAREGRLRLALPIGTLPDGTSLDARAIPLAGPVPLPAVLAGPPLRQRGGDQRIQAVGRTDVPVDIVATVPALPLVGEYGLLVDLESALASNDAGGESVDLAVWLTEDAPDSLVAALSERGVRVLGEQSVAERAHDLAGLGPGLALRFGAFTAVILLLLAAGVAVVGSTVDRSGRVAELVALRGQGLPVQATRVAGLVGAVVLVVGASATGVVATLLSRWLVSARLSVFSDGWAVLPAPGASPWVLLVAVLVVLAVVGLAALAGALRLVSDALAATGAGARRARGAHSRGVQAQ